MSDKSAADFMNDQLEALMASPALARVAERHSEVTDEPVVLEESISERDTQPSIGVQMPREALPGKVKKK